MRQVASFLAVMLIGCSTARTEPAKPPAKLRYVALDAPCAPERDTMGPLGLALRNKDGPALEGLLAPRQAYHAAQGRNVRPAGYRGRLFLGIRQVRPRDRARLLHPDGIPAGLTAEEVDCANARRLRPGFSSRQTGSGSESLRTFSLHLFPLWVYHRAMT